MPNAISPTKRSITYLENRNVLEWLESIASVRQTALSEILREATSSYFLAHTSANHSPTLSEQRSAKKIAERKETDRLIESGIISSAEAQLRNAPILKPVQIVNFWPAIRAHVRANHR